MPTLHPALPLKYSIERGRVTAALQTACIISVALHVNNTAAAFIQSLLGVIFTWHHQLTLHQNKQFPRLIIFERRLAPLRSYLNFRRLAQSLSEVTLTFEGLSKVTLTSDGLYSAARKLRTGGVDWSL
jgi:hypothetical protein